MKQFLEIGMIACVRFAVNAVYSAIRVFPRRKEVVFVSRQANCPSYDFLELGRAFEERGFRATYLTRKFSKKTVFLYAFHALCEVMHLARCEACFIDRYDPIVSLLDFECEHATLTPEQKAFYCNFPIEPVVIQIWHAFGAFKCFGFQSQNTLEGHSFDVMRKYRIHRNYSWVLCSGEGCREAFSQAFNCPIDRVVSLQRPSFDELKRLRALSHEKEISNRILFAPTLRKSAISFHPFQELFLSDDWKMLEKFGSVEWSFHPLETKGVASSTVSESLLRATLVVTDYSSIAYEAYLLGKPVVFYVPDIEEYRVSPGLNTDPLIISPEITFLYKDQLLDFLKQVVEGVRSYSFDGLDRFVGLTVDPYEGNSTERLVESTCVWIDKRKSNDFRVGEPK